MPKTGLAPGFKAGFSDLVDDQVAARVSVITKVADVEVALPVGGDGFPVVGFCAFYLEDTEDLSVSIHREDFWVAAGVVVGPKDIRMVAGSRKARWFAECLA